MAVDARSGATMFAWAMIARELRSPDSPLRVSASFTKSAQVGVPAAAQAMSEPVGTPVASATNTPRASEPEPAPTQIALSMAAPNASAKMPGRAPSMSVLMSASFPTARIEYPGL